MDQIQDVAEGAAFAPIEKTNHDRREAFLAEYDKQKENGADDALMAAMHEYRACSVEEARQWLAERDDPDTANAPADGKWAFNENVTAAFDDMLERSIPNYADMRDFVTKTALWARERSALERPQIVDLGASRGSALAPIIGKLGARARYAAVEVSDPMYAALCQRFKDWVDCGLMTIRQDDLRDGYPTHLGPACCVLSVLTMQFVPVEYRPRLLGSIYDHLAPRGVFVLVEKVLGQTPETDDMMREVYWDLKVEQGYTREAVERKAASLEGVLVPLPSSTNEELLRGAGFAHPEQVWGWGPFRGWVAVKR